MGFGFWVLGLCFGFCVLGFGFWVMGFELLGLRVLGFQGFAGFGVLGFRIWGLKLHLGVSGFSPPTTGQLGPGMAKRLPFSF